MRKLISTLKKARYKHFPFENFLPKITYSQEGEDQILETLFSKHKSKGFFVDIGAHHPFRFSNTNLLYKKGWNGINIEPTPSLFENFKRFRKRDINLNIGIGEESSSLTFYCFNEPALNTFSKSVAVAQQSEQYKIIDKINVQIEPLKTILHQYAKDKTIDLLTIDVEGLDLAVLKSNDWQLFRPRIILVEENKKIYNDEFSDIQEYLLTKGYRQICRTIRTSFFINTAKTNEFF